MYVANLAVEKMGEGGGLDKKGDLNSPQAKGDGTQVLFKQCNSGSESACAHLQAQSKADLEMAYNFIEDNFVEITDNVGGLTSQSRIDDIEFNHTTAYSNARDGDTSTNLGKITLSSNYYSKADLVDSLAHELLHSGEGYFGRAYTNLQDKYSSTGFGARHTEIYSKGAQAKALYLKLNP